MLPIIWQLLQPMSTIDFRGKSTAACSSPSSHHGTRHQARSPVAALCLSVVCLSVRPLPSLPHNCHPCHTNETSATREEEHIIAKRPPSHRRCLPSIILPSSPTASTAVRCGFVQTYVYCMCTNDTNLLSGCVGWFLRS